ncbi:hypothetical protein BVG79_01886 [Ketogulonicigenium robustum]|uniref:Lipoprotein n=1 Tax=Ketogulonicigenium robustum TaxID=92947 RepID=A0A1W6P138_9RHOB|nr:hypothetical protein [Ketogulonicigenium robustum]ARO15228.1 hypothetical protein BVG79_01886 [Ketogulonicigenium robustum]
MLIDTIKPVALLAALGVLAGCTSDMFPSLTRAQQTPTQTAPAAQTPPASNLAPADRLLASIESEGCILQQGNVASVLLRANLTQQQLMELAPQLASSGRAEVTPSGTIRVITPRCA